MSYIGTEPKDIRSFGRTKFDYTATQGQTAFTGADDDGKVLAFTVGQIEVYVNGILMDDSDFTTTGTGTVTLASAANLNDVINIVSFESNIPDNDYVPASGGTFTGNVTHSGTTTMSGDLTVDTNTLKVDSSNNRVGMGTASPSQRLHVEGTGNQFILLNNSSTNDGMYLKAGTGASSIQTNGGSHVLNFFTSGTERMKIDNSGRVTKPYQPAFKASIQTQAAPRTTTNTETVTPYDTAQLNIGNHYNTSNYRFTAPVAGNYFFSLTQNKVGKLIIYLRKNGSNFHAGEFLQDTGGAWDHCTISCVIPLAATDYVEASFKLVNNSSTQYAWNGGSALWDSFSGFLIG